MDADRGMVGGRGVEGVDLRGREVYRELDKKCHLGLKAIIWHVACGK